MFFWNSGFMCGQWCSDAMLEGMAVTRDEAWQIPMIQASVIGIRFDADRGFLDEWKACCDRGLFFGSGTNRNREISRDPGVDGHRHDQSVASILRHRLEFPMCPPGWCVYSGVTDKTVFQNKGPE